MRDATESDRLIFSAYVWKQIKAIIDKGICTTVCALFRYFCFLYNCHNNLSIAEMQEPLLSLTLIGMTA
jgi:elongation factor P hydroxylase